MNRFRAAFRGPVKPAAQGCCPECTPACSSRQLRMAARERALRFRAGL